MKVIIVILMIVILILSLFIFKLFHEIKLINKQAEIKVKTDSNFIITSDVGFQSYTELCNHLNILYDKYRGEKDASANREKEFKEMLSYIAHDVRTPLTSVQGYLQILQEKDLNEENEDYYKIVNQRIYDIRNLLEQFFIYSKLLNHDYKLEVEECNLYNLCCNSLAGFYQAFSNQNIEPVIDFEQHDLIISVNQDLMKRVFDNLINNAFTHGNGNIVIKQTGNKIIFSNEFKAEIKIDKDKVFSRFYKADTSRSNISSGLGLSVVKKIIELFNWNIEVEIKENIFMIVIFINDKLQP